MSHGTIGIHSQAHHRSRYQDVYNEITDDAIDQCSDIVAAGIEAGLFRPVDGDTVAHLLDDVITGVHAKRNVSQSGGRTDSGA